MGLWQAQAQHGLVPPLGSVNVIEQRPRHCCRLHAPKGPHVQPPQGAQEPAWSQGQFKPTSCTPTQQLPSAEILHMLLLGGACAHISPCNWPGLYHVQASDTSTGIVLNALAADRFPLGGEASRYLKRSFVTTNHFDIDSFLSVWCFLNRDLARQHEAGELQRGKAPQTKLWLPVWALQCRPCAASPS